LTKVNYDHKFCPSIINFFLKASIFRL